MAIRSTRPGGAARSPGSEKTGRLAGLGALSRGLRTTPVGRPDEFDRQRRIWWGVNILLALCLLGLVALAGTYGHSAYKNHQIQEGRDEAAAAARQVVVDFLTISAPSVTEDLNQVLQSSTGEFRKQYESGMSEVRAAVVENKVSSTGKVLRSGVESGDADSAVVLVAVDAKIKNVRSPEGRKAHYRVKVDMVYDDDKERWMVSRLEFVG